MKKVQKICKYCSEVEKTNIIMLSTNGWRHKNSKKHKENVKFFNLKYGNNNNVRPEPINKPQKLTPHQIWVEKVKSEASEVNNKVPVNIKTETTNNNNDSKRVLLNNLNMIKQKKNF